MRVRQACVGPPRARRYIQYGVIMIDQNIRRLALGRRDQNADIERIIAAIISTTRRAWQSPVSDPRTHSRNDANWNRLAHPLIRFALDPKRINAWRARIDRQAPLQSLERLAVVDGTPVGARQNRAEHEKIRPLKIPQNLVRNEFFSGPIQESMGDGASNCETAS